MKLKLLNNLVYIEKDKILEEVNSLKLYGYRFVSITCEYEDSNYELTYHFDLNYTMKHLRVIVLKEDTIKSISPIYAAAFLIENEYQDFYGFKFTDLSIDYSGRLYLTENSPQKPLLAKTDK